MLNRTLGQNISGEIRDIKKNIEEFSITPVAYRGDWVELAEPSEYVTITNSPINSYPFTYTMKFSNVDIVPSTFLQKGDKLRLKQGGSYKYFYISSISGVNIVITAGIDYVLTSATITDLAYSRMGAPTGFPSQFNAKPDFFCSGTLALIPPIAGLTASFFVINGIVFVSMNAPGYTLSGSGQFIYVQLPIPWLGTSGVAFSQMNWGQDGDGTNLNIISTINSTGVVGFAYSSIGHYKQNGANWATGSGGTLRSNVQYPI